MMNCTRVGSVEYYEAQAQIATMDKEAVRDISGRDQVAYYVDNGAGESVGTWWARGNGAHSTFLHQRGLSPFCLCKDGAEVDGRVLRDLAVGRDPGTRQSLVKNSANGKRTAGFDVQISAPKSVSLLAAFGDNVMREKVFCAHDRAFRRALDFIFDDGLIDARQGQAGQGPRNPPAEVAAAVYRHFTSRAKDPQLHSHGVLMNLAVRADGTTGGIDNSTIMKYRGAIAALYRSELANELRRELGIEVEKKDRNFEIAGVPEQVVELFSKRRSQIEKIAKEMGFNTEANRNAAQLAAYQSRDTKDRETPLSELETKWVRELLSSGWNPATLFQSVRIQSDHVRLQREAEGEKAVRMRGLAITAIEAMSEHDAVFTRAGVLRVVIEAVQCQVSANEALEIVSELERSGAIIKLGLDDSRQPVFSTAALIEAERKMLSQAIEGRNSRDFVDAETLERVLAARTTMAEEQKQAVRHALNRDGISIVEGSAGTGKSFAMATVAEVARDCGNEIQVIAPSWKAVDVIKSDTETAEDMARAVQGFLNRVEKGEIVLEPNTTIIADEAGMIGTLDMARLVASTASAGSKLVLTGDSKQLQPVAAGAPLVALSRTIGASRMDEIRRQRGRNEVEGQWMRAASKDFAVGDPIRALEAYDRAGAINWAEDRDETIRQLVNDYCADLEAQSGITSTRAILSGWNLDVREINSQIRAVLQSKGQLQDEILIPVLPRGSKEVDDLAFAAGDKIIFGETLELEGVTIRNADLGEILSISKEADPQIVFRLQKDGGRDVSARMSELVGRRKDGEPSVPKIQHSYAMTVHASQGVTVDHCYVANLRGMGRESTYVAMTRHRQTARLYADTSRIRDRLEASRPGKMLSGKTQTETLELEDRSADVSDADVRTAFMEEVKKSDLKMNPSDFVPDIKQFVAAPPVIKEPALAFVDGKPVHIEPHAVEQEQPQPAPAEQMKDRMEARMNSPAEYPVPPANSSAIKQPEQIGMSVEANPEKGSKNHERSNDRDNRDRSPSIELAPNPRPEQRERSVREYLRVAHSLTFAPWREAKSLNSLRNLSSSRMVRLAGRTASLLQGDVRPSLQQRGEERPASLRRSGNGDRTTARQATGRIAQFDKMMVDTQNLLKVATQQLGGNLLRSWNSNRDHEVQFGNREEKVKISKSERTGLWSWSTITDTTKRGAADLVAKVKEITPAQAFTWLRDRTLPAMANPIARALESSPTEIARRRIDFIIGKTAAVEVEKAKAPDRDRGVRRDDGLSI